MYNKINSAIPQNFQMNRIQDEPNISSLSRQRQIGVNKTLFLYIDKDSIFGFCIILVKIIDNVYCDYFELDVNSQMNSRLPLKLAFNRNLV